MGMNAGVTAPAVGVIVAIIVIIIAAVVTIRSRSIILRFDKHAILDAGPRDMTSLDCHGKDAKLIGTIVLMAQST